MTLFQNGIHFGHSQHVVLYRNMYCHHLPCSLRPKIYSSHLTHSDIQSMHVLQSSLITDAWWIYRNFIGQETKPGHICGLIWKPYRILACGSSIWVYLCYVNSLQETYISMLHKVWIVIALHANSVGMRTRALNKLNSLSIHCWHMNTVQFVTLPVPTCWAFLIKTKEIGG